MQWFDAHLDLAYLEATGREMNADPSDAGGPDLPASVTLRSLAEGGVRACLATIFTEIDGSDPRISYPNGDAVRAERVGIAQLNLYERWKKAGLVDFLPRRGRESPENNVDEHTSAEMSASATGPLCVGLLVEGADPISGPEELSLWVSRGVIAVGLAWARETRYAGGNTTKTGLTDLGRAMVNEIDRLGVVHDGSHLSDRALDELFGLTDRVVIASHSNCRAIIDGPDIRHGTPSQRHLTDNAIREITRRGGVIGINLFSKFLIPGGKTDRRASLDEFASHVERICEIAGDRLHVGLGSDMDGGFSSLALPEGINRPRDLVLLSDKLSMRGWSDSEVHDFAWGNWARFWCL